MKRDSLITSSLIEEVLSSVYAEHKQPKLVHYEQAVAKLKCEKLGLEPGTYSHRQVHTSVWRSLNGLVEKGIVIKDGDFYYGKAEYEDYCGKNDFKKLISPANNTFQLISDNTVALKLSDANDHDLINKAVVQKFGEDNVYASFVCDKVLVIIFNREFSNNNCYKELKDAVEEAFTYHLLNSEINLIQYLRNSK